VERGRGGGGRGFPSNTVQERSLLCRWKGEGGEKKGKKPC